MSYHYAFDAAKLLQKCLSNIQQVIDHDERRHKRSWHPSNSSLYDMKEALAQAERQLFLYFVFIIQKEQENLATNMDILSTCVDLASSVEVLEIVLAECSLQERRMQQQQQQSDELLSSHTTHTYYPRRSATDSLLFRLNVALQLCLVRIDGARLVICSGGAQQHDSEEGGGGGESSSSSCATSAVLGHSCFMAAAGLLGVTTLSLVYARSNSLSCGCASGGKQSLQAYQPLLLTTAKTGAALLVGQWLQKKWSNLWMTSKLVRSTEKIEEWSRQWMLIQSTPYPPHHSRRQQQQQPRRPSQASTFQQQAATEETVNQQATETSLDAARSRRLIEYALYETPKTSFWQSQGELRFLMLKRAMDVFYASVGTAMDLTNTGTKTISVNEKSDAANWQLTVVTAAASSFYSLTGARDRAAAVTSSSESASNLIQNAWGMVSLPAVKNLSLQASRLLKGAAVADRIEICGVHCFVLSSEPAPELAAAIKRSQRLHQRRKPIATLSTIDEQEEHTPAMRRASAKPFARSSSTRYRQRDVIFHLTGGGFFAHIIASDLPYLLDWSASTGGVVICPEYALLPEHTFPTALHQVEDVYHALVSDEAVSVLGFETNRIVVTGESAGGNLAASLCIKLCMDKDAEDAVSLPGGGDAKLTSRTDEDDRVELSFATENSSALRMPNALMLSCPVLNLSLEMSHSRVIGTEDPVLPSGLLSAISDAYLPSDLGISKKDPLASPFYASDAILRQFPPTLLFASSTDPLLDDSVVFNQRLRGHGVESDLLAANNLPHAYLGLGTAGFPEAKKVQEQCVDWLIHQLTREWIEVSVAS